MSLCLLCIPPAPALESCTDDVLIEHIRGGCPVAEDVLYQRQVPNVLSYLLKTCIRHDEAPDSAVEAFREALVRYERGRGEFRSLLFIIAKRIHCAKINTFERFWKRFYTLAEPEPSVAATVHGEVELHQCVDRLKAEYREVVELQYFGGLTAPEIARVLGLKLSTVECRRRAALDLLRKQLGPGH